MYSGKKALKPGGKNRNPRQVSSQPAKEKHEDLPLKVNSTNPQKSPSLSGLVFSIHPIWPDLPQNQSKLFFECTLFLYSVLALFLQYLNLYKTLWWLPKSHWHTSMKFYLINPYLLSCIGLLLGTRVTICFWNTVSEKNADLLKSSKGWKMKTFGGVELIIRFFLLFIVFSSFCFSFSRIFLEFGIKTLIYFGYPIIFYVMSFHRHCFYIIYQLIFGDDLPFFSLNFWRKSCHAFSYVFRSDLIDLESVVHLCTNAPSRNREEAKVLVRDFECRFKSCVFTGIFTAYFAVFMPRIFIPEKSDFNDSQFMLVDDVWMFHMFLIVAVTAFMLYATYLFPIQYFDLLHRCAAHLGYWRRLRPSRTVEESAVPFNTDSDLPYSQNTIVVYNGEYYQSEAFSEVKTISAIPNDEDHIRLNKFGADPVQMVGYTFVAQFIIIAGQFWALILASEWQKIVTLVLLMFANYLLLAKVFKDYVVIGRIYKPSGEDLRLISRLKTEMSFGVGADVGASAKTILSSTTTTTTTRSSHNKDYHKHRK